MKKILFVISIMIGVIGYNTSATASIYEPFGETVKGYGYNQSVTHSVYNMPQAKKNSYQGGYLIDDQDVMGDYTDGIRNLGEVLYFGYDEMFKTDGPGSIDDETTQFDGGSTGNVETPLNFPHFMFAFMFAGYIFLLIRRKIRLMQHQ